MNQSRYNLMFLIFFILTSLCLWKVDIGVQKALKEVHDLNMQIPLEGEQQGLVLKQTQPKQKVLVKKKKRLVLSKEETNCLALNVYFEARNQDTPGQIAVAFVTINRKLNKYFKNDICEVVKQGYRKRQGSCAFSWYCDGVSDRPKDKVAWSYSKQVTKWAVENYYTQLDYYSEKPTHYHADYIKKPWWTKDMKRIVKIGNHIFYSGV
jgi:spore germination cell wall hydrolase CwlJ-like protein